MKNALLILTAVLFILASCSYRRPDDAVKQARMDDSLIRVYLSNNPMIKALKDSSGLYYQIIQQGTGAYPTVNSTVTVNYEGRLLNGPKFDSASGFSSTLDRLVKGWQIGLTHIKPGGSILLIVPSALGYGSNNLGPIPANSVLVFNIELVASK